MKSKKTIESFIGKMIFGSLMALPLLSILCRSLYVICNKNAYQSYSQYQTKEIINISQAENLQLGRTYTITYTSGLTNGQTFYVENNQTNIVEKYFTNQNWQVNYFIPTYENNKTRLIVYDTNGNQHNMFNWQATENNFWFVSTGQNSTNANNNFAYTISTLETTTDKLDNVWEYSLNQIQKSSYYNWVENTATYNVIQSTTNTLQINMPVLDMLLTYWLMITLIYIIFDIVYVMLMLAHDKIHGLIEK